MPRPLVNPNLCNDVDVRRVVKEEYVPLVKRIRTDRNVMRETWIRYMRLWSCTRDQQSYQGRSQTYIGETRKLIDNWTRRIVRDLFPTGDWYDIKATRRAYEPRIPGWKAISSYCFEHYAKVKRAATPWVRQMVTLGTSPVKVVWRQEIREMEYLHEMLDAEGHLTGRSERRMQEIVDFLGPTFRPVDLFAWYVFPYTVSDVKDADIVFEDLLVSRDRIRAMSRKDILPDDPTAGRLYDPKAVERTLDRFIASGKARDKFDAEARRLSDKGFTHVLDMKMNPALWPVDITEGTWRQDLEGKGPRRYLITLGADEEILRVQETPFAHGLPHWLAGKFTEVVDEFYGHGLPELVDRLNYTLIDVADQGNDALTWSMNPITAVDMFKVQDPTTLRMRPGAKWLIDPTGIKMFEPPKESATAAFAAMAQYREMMHSMADVVPVGGAMPKSRGRGQQSASGMQMMMSEAQVDIKEVVENNEQVMVDFLRMSHSLFLQFLDRKVTLQVTGSDGAVLIEQDIGVEDVVGEFEYTWLGSVQTQNTQVRAGQMVNFLGMITKIPPEQLQSQNIDVDLKYILREIWGTGMQLPNPERVVRDKVKQVSVDWKIENDLFRLHRAAEVTVAEADNHVEHAEGHYHVFKDPDLDPEVGQAVYAHIRGHVAAHMAKQMMQKQQEAQQQAQRQGLLNAGAPQRGGGPPGGGGGGPQRLAPPAGPGRMAQTAGMDDLFRQLPRVPGG